MKAILTTGVITIGFIVAVVGCGSQPPHELGASGSIQGQSANPIPVVKSPRNIAAVASRPCALLTAQQVGAFGLDLPPRVYNAELGDVGCEWTNVTRDRRISRRVQIDTFTNNPTLEIGYQQDQGRPFFELTEIIGYPALVSRPLADEPICDVDVKTAERQSFSLTYESKEFARDPQQACVVAKQIAAAVLMNLPLKG
jgi:hypothetical protein